MAVIKAREQLRTEQHESSPENRLPKKYQLKIIMCTGDNKYKPFKQAQPVVSH